MSLTATVDPYDREQERELQAERERATRAAEESKRRRREYRLLSADALGAPEARAAATSPPVVLRMRNSAELVKTAGRLGYHLVPIAHRTEEELCLQRGAQTRQLIRRRLGIEIISSAGRAAAQELVREHVLDRAVQHLRGRNLEVKIRRTADNSIEVAGREASPASAGQCAVVTAVVSRAGQMAVDVSCLQGQRCETIVQDLARAVEGDLMTEKKKDYFVRTASTPKVVVGG